MTDKVKLILAEIEKRYEYWKEKEHHSHSAESEIRMSECQHLLQLLNSLPEESVSDIKTRVKEIFDSCEKIDVSDGEKNRVAFGLLELEGFAKIFYKMGKQQEESVPTPHKEMDYERWKKACEAASCDANYRSHFGLTETKDDYFVDGVQWADEHPIKQTMSLQEKKDLIASLQKDIEEPVSEELEEAAKKHAYSCHTDTATGKRIAACIYDFKAGAKWQKEQMMTNTTDAMIGLPYENKDGKYTQLIDVSRPLPVGNNKIAIIFKED